MSTEQATAPRTTGAGPSGPRAGFWLRFAAALLDGLLISLVTAVIFFLVDENVGLYYAFSTLLQAVYFTLMEGSARGQTVGKMVCGIRVIGIADGRSIGPVRAFIRWIGRIPSGMVFLLGYLWMLWDGEKQTWHDKLSSAVVVPTDAYPTS